MHLDTFSDAAGRTLFDIPGAPLGDPASEAPARLLAPFDNVVLAHADRERIIDPATRERLFRDRLMRAFLIDGFVAGTWALDKHALSILPARALAERDIEELRVEGEGLLRFVHSRPADAQIVIHKPPSD
jgi:hypothetical protein